MAVVQPIPSSFSKNTIIFPKWVDNVVLSAGAVTYTVPAGASFCIISCDAPIWVSDTGTAAVPTVNVLDGTGSFYLSGASQMRLDGGTISLIKASATANVSIGVYLA